jgi:cyanophycinase
VEDSIVNSPTLFSPSRCFLVLALVFVSSSVLLPATVGPDRGTLVVVGGGGDIEPILHRFVELAGGKQAPIVVIPTAGGAPSYDAFHPTARWFRDEAGVQTVTVLHTRDRVEADSEAFVESIRNARAVWFPGGRQWRLADSYLGTRTQAELEALLARGGVIGGSSAGATIQGSYLARGDTQTNTVMMGDHEEGFGFMRNVAIDQHVMKRNRQFDLVEIISAKPELLGIGIDENAAIIVRGDTFSVMQGYVAIYDHAKQLPNGGKFYLLSDGDRFNLATREASREGYSSDEFEKIESDPW